MRAIGQALRTDHSTEVELEPHTYENRRRNDIRWRGSAVHGRATIDYDVKVISLLGAKTTLTTTRPPANTLLSDHASSQSIRYLDTVGRKAISVRPLSMLELRSARSRQSKPRADWGLIAGGMPVAAVRPATRRPKTPNAHYSPNLPLPTSTIRSSHSSSPEISSDPTWTTVRRREPTPPAEFGSTRC